MSKDFFSISEVSTGLFKVKGSKFLSFAHPVKSEDDIKVIQDFYRKKYHDARHICYAWVLGPSANNFRSNDDGEPSGTAGKPILLQIQANDLTNIIVIVVRYFGGILLGTGGLANAYKTATLEALNKAHKIPFQIFHLYEITFDYIEMEYVMKIIKEFKLNIIDQQIDQKTKIILAIDDLQQIKVKTMLNKNEAIVMKYLRTE